MKPPRRPPPDFSAYYDAPYVQQIWRESDHILGVPVRVVMFSAMGLGAVCGAALVRWLMRR